MRLSIDLRCKSFWPRRILCILKMSTFDFFRSRYDNLNEKQMLDQLLREGKDPQEIGNEHLLQIDCIRALCRVVRKLDIEVRIIKRIGVAKMYIDWADLVIPIGGDGTFLLASKLIRDNKKAIMGINPSSKYTTFSLPTEYSQKIEKIFERLHKGDYQLLMRSRIRTTMIGEDLYAQPFHVHEKSRDRGERRISGLTKRFTKGKTANTMEPQWRVLPWLALNEIFIGEFLPSRSITLTIQVDDGEECTNRSSGICVCTGSGSRLWYRSMNIITPNTIQTLASMANSKKLDEKKIIDVIQRFGQNLVFHPEDRRMAYMIREMYQASTWPKPKSYPQRQMCHQTKVRSSGFDAGLIIDCSVSLPFNDGSIAFFEIHPEYALKNIVFT